MCKIFLDSGAFSAWMQRGSIDIDKYIEFIHQNKDVIEVYANLDIITNPKATLRNQKIMEQAGLTPLPVYHYGEDIRFLKYYIKRYSYIALGNMVPISTKHLILWLDCLFTKHIPSKTRIHGFGLTRHNILIKYPWYSVDSTSWMFDSKVGAILVPKRMNYQVAPWKITISNRSPLKKQIGRHLSNFTKMQQQVIIQYIKEKGYVLGKSEFNRVSVHHKLESNERWFGRPAQDRTRIVERIDTIGVCNNYVNRDMINIQYYNDLQNSLSKIIYLAGTPATVSREQIIKSMNTNRLFSFYYIEGDKFKTKSGFELYKKIK